MSKVSLLHTKGLLTLWLVLLAESLTLVHSVSFWSPLNKATKQPRSSFFAQAVSTEDTQTCSFDNTPSKECCVDCHHCLPSAQTQWCLDNVRGGHAGHAHSHASAAADVLASATTPYGLPLHAWKVIFQTLLTAMNVLCWYLPLKSKKISFQLVKKIC